VLTAVCIIVFHANELQRISDVNHQVSFVDAQGNTLKRFVTHEPLERHLGYDLVSMQDFNLLLIWKRSGKSDGQGRV